ncbi:unnamed protein product [Trichobilharzia regenti]|nr:unnamed protein product [Trichobilharzia regenti]
MATLFIVNRNTRWIVLTSLQISTRCPIRMKTVHVLSSVNVGSCIHIHSVFFLCRCCLNCVDQVIVVRVILLFIQQYNMHCWGMVLLNSVNRVEILAFQLNKSILQEYHPLLRCCSHLHQLIMTDRYYISFHFCISFDCMICEVGGILSRSLLTDIDWTIFQT